MNPILLPAYNPGLMTGQGNNTYLLATPAGGATLIDAGVGQGRHLVDIDERLSAGRARLEQVLVTHGHPDHAAGAPALATAHPNARFYKYSWPDADMTYPVQWRGVTDGDRLAVGSDSLIALHTPGHAPDHVVFWHEDSGTMFTGDLVVQGGTVMIHASRGGDLGQYLESLERIRALKPRRLLPAHGPVVTDPERVLTAYLQHRRDREAQVLAALAAGLDTVESIAESIYDGLAPALMPAARETTRAHLEKLKKERRAFEEDARWKA